MADPSVDVLIAGAGPVGLVIGYHLTLLGHSVYLLDAADKAAPDFPMYGRASMLHARSLEYLDQLDLLDDLLQVGLVGRQCFTYRDGVKVLGRGWKFPSRTETNCDYSLNVRLKYSEDVFRRRLGELGVQVHAPVRLADFRLDGEGACPVVAECVDVRRGATFTVRAKYIVGADGGNSTVRKVAGIPFIGERHVQYWVRMDGIVKTNVPEARSGLGFFESKTHGHVLWNALDHGATRIGYVLSEELAEKYGRRMTAAQAAAEAVKAVTPFELEWEEVQWHTVYGIQQHVAETFFDKGRVFLAGEAAHTHSSGAAQGMNTGIHDAMALSWRLAGALKGWYVPEVLSLYSDERRLSSQHLIDVDRTMSKLMSGQIPDSLKDRGDDPMVLADEMVKEQSAFLFGLGISYPPNLLNDVAGSKCPLAIAPGHRFMDVDLYRNGDTKRPVRLLEVAKLNGQFRVIVFTGVAADTQHGLHALRVAVDEHAGQFEHALEFLTIIAGYGNVFDEHLGVRRFGRAFWDIDHSAHRALDVSTVRGAIAVVRPDGLLGFSAELDGFMDVVKYLGRVIVPQKREQEVKNGGASKTELGDFLGENEEAVAVS